MKMVQAIIRREKENDIAQSLERSGFSAMTKWDVLGRGKQRGIKIGSAKYEEMPKVMVMIVVEDKDLERAIDILKVSARTGNYGDGKVFVTEVEDVCTIRSGERTL